MNTLEQLFLEYKAVRKEEAVVSRKETTFCKMIDFCIHEGKEADALWLCDDAIVQYPFVADFYFTKAALQIKNSLFDEGFVTLKKGAQLSPTSLKYFLIHADLYLTKNDFQAALNVLKAAEQVLGQYDLVEIYLSKSRIYRQLNRLESEFSTLKKALLIDAGNLEAHQRLFWVIERLGFYEESIELNRHLTGVNPYCAWAWYNLATALVAMEETEFYAEAIEAYEYAFSIEQNFMRAYSECADLYFDMKKYAAALHYFERALAAHVNDEGLMTRIAECHLHLGNLEAAETCFLKALELNADNEETLFGLGNCRFQQQKYEEAWSDYRKAAQLNPDDPRYTHALAVVYAKQTLYKEAFIYFRKTVDLEPETLQYWFDFIDFLIKNGNADRADATLKESELYHPADPKVDLYFLILMLEKGQRSRALYHLHDLLGSEPQLKNWIFTARPDWANEADILKVLCNSSQ